MPQSTNTGRVQYTGQLAYEPGVDLYHYKARTYAPRLGRFLQPDPIGYAGGMNLYAYVLNDAMNLADPLGLHHLGKPVTDEQISPVYPVAGAPFHIGRVQTFFSDDGLSATNITLEGHWLCCGQVDIRNFLARGWWFVGAHGYGSNYPGVGSFNQWYGPEVFRGMLGDYIMVVRSRLGR